MAFNEGRGFTPGDTCRCEQGHPLQLDAFNEGRGFTPGDTVPFTKNETDT